MAMSVTQLQATGSLSREMGSVVLQVAGMELLARYSMNSGRATSLLSSLHEFRSHEVEVAGNREWNWKYLRDQFDQKSLEDLYRKYDDKLRQSYITIFLGLNLICTLIHLAAVIFTNVKELSTWHPTHLAIICYVLKMIMPILVMKCNIYDPYKEKYVWVPVVLSLVVIVILIVLDITITLYDDDDEMSLRPGYATATLIAAYVFLPLRNNYIALAFGTIITFTYVAVIAVSSYELHPNSHYIIICDFLYLLGVNLLGLYFRLMNEVVTRRSFLDRRACVETTLKVNYEKSQEEQLLSSILPEHIASRVRQDIRTTFLRIQSHDNTFGKKAISHLYIEEHNDVSILYADVVNYTMISTTLPALRMVELLSELFGRFDEVSEEHEVLRIKFLGDCYYCVSGIPEPNPQHAKSCVDLGLDMISIIKDVREKRSLNMDMRIGVHTGNILSGIVGLRKWQYDVWSKDVSIANKMESTGKPGKVHVTKQTLESLQEAAREYIIEPNFDAQRDPFLMKNKIETYLLTRPSRAYLESKPFRRVSVGLNRFMKKGPNTPKVKSENARTSYRRRTTAFMDNNLIAYQQMLKTADLQMEKEFDSMPSGNITNFFGSDKNINLWTLMFKGNNREKPYLMMPDPLFKYYITASLVVFILIFFINGLTTTWYQGFPIYTWVLFAIFILGLTILQPLSWFQFVWTKWLGVDEPRNPFLRKIYDISANIVRSVYVRTAVYLIISMTMVASATVNVIDCSVDSDNDADFISDCMSPWHVTQTWALTLLLSFLFSRVFFLCKWVMGMIMTAFYMWVVWEIKSELFIHDSSWNVGMDSRIAHTMSVLFLTITLYWVDRQTEYRKRLDHMWQVQLTEEKEEASTMLKVNSMLLQNILPAHVADIYLDVNRRPDELYYEKYDNIAVMFASLTDYKMGLEEDAEMSERILLGILDQIISDFDRLLLIGQQSSFKVEKIKLAGWTYMAACGLDPGRGDSFSSISLNSDDGQESARDRGMVLTMVQFAAAMMLQLRSFNRSSFQSFEGINLRVGISNGEVAAGVVGSLKPLYDIWGNAVNMASRMDSTGETGKIHVTENTAIVLDNMGVLTEYRGRTFVKGAGYVRTYFVPLDAEFNLIKKDEHIDRRISDYVTDIDEGGAEYYGSSIKTKVDLNENDLAEAANKGLEKQSDAPSVQIRGHEENLDAEGEETSADVKVNENNLAEAAHKGLEEPSDAPSVEIRGLDENSDVEGEETSTDVEVEVNQESKGTRC